MPFPSDRRKYAYKFVSFQDLHDRESPAKYEYRRDRIDT